MLCRRVTYFGKTVPLSIIILVVSGLAGCRSLPDVKLGECEELDIMPFIEAFDFMTAGTIRYRYSFHRNNVDFTCNGITQQKDGGIYIAGFSNAGITLFSAFWENGHFSVLRNNTKMTESFLENSILGDLLIMYCRPSGNECCVRRDLLSDSVWLEMKNGLAGETGYFSVLGNDLAWVGVQKGKVCYRAETTKNEKSILEYIIIENYDQAYHSEIQIKEFSDSQGNQIGNFIKRDKK